jgi:ankyrin repeat protein
LKAWRSVDKSIPLDSSILFPAHGPVVASPSPASLALEKEFFAALTHDDLSTVKKLLIYTPDLISSRDEYGSTPLAVALINGHKDEAEFLLANHADINAREGGGRTLLHVLAMNRGVWAVEKAELLLANNADVDARDGGGGTPLNLAALTGNKDMAEWLLAHHADVNAKNVRGWTPLHQAARWGQKEIAELLLAHNADVNARDKEGKTPLQLAHAHRNERSKNVAEVLRQHGGR